MKNWTKIYLVILALMALTLSYEVIDFLRRIANID